MKIQWGRSHIAANFPTFCHISEYGQIGYANLHRLIAASAPLILWAPSTQLLTSPECKVDEHQFLDLVDSGCVRILARDWWYSDQRRRNTHDWAPAHWNWRVDRPLSRMAREDEDLEPDQRRVVIAPSHAGLPPEYNDDMGQYRAELEIGERPELVDEINALLRSEDSRRTVPAGVLETALRHSGEPRLLAIRILRDAFNHSEAVRISNTRAPFYLAPREGVFLKMLQETLEQDSLAPSDAQFVRGSLSPEAFTALSAEVIGLLEQLDHAGSGVSLKKFMSPTGGNALLAKWFAELCADLSTGRAQPSDQVAAERLREQFDASELLSSVQDNAAGFAGATTLLGSGASVLDATLALASQQTPTIFSAVGLATGVIGVLQIVQQVTGKSPVPFSGPQWPFLYAFGQRATGDGFHQLTRVLDNLD